MLMGNHLKINTQNISGASQQEPAKQTKKLTWNILTPSFELHSKYAKRGQEADLQWKFWLQIEFNFYLKLKFSVLKLQKCFMDENTSDYPLPHGWAKSNCSSLKLTKSAFWLFVCALTNFERDSSRGYFVKHLFGVFLFCEMWRQNGKKKKSFYTNLHCLVW